MYKNKKIKDPTIKQWTCPQCGKVHGRDVNAAIHIRDNANIRVV